jgi:hypothetical protein
LTPRLLCVIMGLVPEGSGGAYLWLRADRRLLNSKLGASSRTRTGTLILARDFKSLVSTYSTKEALCWTQPRANLLQVPELDSRYSEVPTWTVLLTACLIAIGILAIVVGLPCRIRTYDPQLRRLLLYPAELRAVMVGPHRLEL